MNALAHALAHGEATAMCRRSVHAKRSEVKTPEVTSPEVKFLERQGQTVTQVTRRDPRTGLDLGC